MKRNLFIFNSIILGLIFIVNVNAFAKEEIENKKKYWIFFDGKDKLYLKALNKNVNSLRVFLSGRAIKRRKKVKVYSNIIDETDLPVNAEYIDRLLKAGVKIINVSKWLNGVSAYLSENEKGIIEDLQFVREIKPVLKLINRPVRQKETELFKIRAGFNHRFDYGISFTQNDLINIPVLHDLGIVGRNVFIGMLDSGFILEHESLENVIVIDEWDFVNNDGNTGKEAGDPIEQHKHGTMTLAVIGGFREGKLIGPAFGSTFAIAKTEIIDSELAVEEDNWVRGIEWLDSLGVDVVSSSVGYASNFADRPDYGFSDLDGKTAVTTIAAEMAVQKGIVVVNSAGNERIGFGHIVTPSDGENVIAVGAVNVLGDLAYFSSPGPTYDERIKPDVVSMGIGVIVPDFQFDSFIYDGYEGVNGTSFSCPLIAGTAALILSAHPNLTPAQVKEALIETADRADNPDNDYGYGLVDAYKAVLYFGTVFSNKPDLKVIGSKYRITTRIVSPSGIPEDNIYLLYKNSSDGGEFQTVSMSEGINNQNQYYAEVPVVSLGSSFSYYFSVTDSSGIQTFNPYNAPNSSYFYLSPFSQELKSFTHQVYSRRFVLLDWTMRYQTDNLGFDIEKSLDEQNFVKIGSVSGDGTITHEKKYFFSDKEVNSGIYYYRLKKKDYSGYFDYSEPIKVTIENPDDFSVSQNYPNPFNLTTTINFQISQETDIEIKIFDVLGREIKTLINEKMKTGFYEVIWDGRDKNELYVSSGIYFYRFKAGDFTNVKKIVLLK